MCDESGEELPQDPRLHLDELLSARVAQYKALRLTNSILDYAPNLHSRPPNIDTLIAHKVPFLHDCLFGRLAVDACIRACFVCIHGHIAVSVGLVCC